MGRRADARLLLSARLHTTGHRVLRTALDAYCAILTQLMFSL